MSEGSCMGHGHVLCTMEHHRGVPLPWFYTLHLVQLFYGLRSVPSVDLPPRAPVVYSIRLLLSDSSVLLVIFCCIRVMSLISLLRTVQFIEGCRFVVGFRAISLRPYAPRPIETQLCSYELLCGLLASNGFFLRYRLH